MIIHPPTTQYDGRYKAFFSKGDAVHVIKDNGESACASKTVLDQHGIAAGTEVSLVRWDGSDNTWLVGFDYDNRYHEVWVFQDCIALVNPVTDEDVEEAIASIKMGMHPDLLAMLAYEDEAIAQGYKDGDVNHYVQPVIGILRRKLANGELPDKEFLEYAVDRLLKACKAETAWLKKRERES